MTLYQILILALFNSQIGSKIYLVDVADTTKQQKKSQHYNDYQNEDYTSYVGDSNLYQQSYVSCLKGIWS